MKLCLDSLSLWSKLVARGFELTSWGLTRSTQNVRGLCNYDQLLAFPIAKIDNHTSHLYEKCKTLNFCNLVNANGTKVESSYNCAYFELSSG